jgi:SAM-dependent methyltransferase
MTFADVDPATVARWWDERPCNVGHAADPVAGTAEVRALRYAREPHNVTFMQPWRWQDKVVVEVGCGIGTNALDLARYAAVVYGFDVSEASLRIARRRADREGVGGLVLARWDAENPEPPIWPGRVDLIWSYGALHHTPHPAAALANLRRFADPGTELRVMLYHRWSTKGLRLGLTDRRVARGSEARADCPVTYAYSRRQARRLLERAGWRVESVTVDHILDRRTRLPSRLPRVVHRTLGWHLLLVAHPGL